MSTSPLSDALTEEVKRIQVEESATATKAERLADPSIAPPSPAPAAAAPTTAAKPNAAEVLQSLPPELVTPLLVMALDIVVRKVATWVSSEEAAARLALTADEHQQLAKVWAPIVAFYLPQLSVHPLVAAIGTTGLIYGLKALPEGGLEAALAGAAGGPAPQAVSTASLVKPNGEPKPAVDPVLALAEQQAEELKRQRERDASKAVSA